LPVTEVTNIHIVCYDKPEITLYEIFKEYGTIERPKLDPSQDPPKPLPKEKKVKEPKKVVEKVEGQEG
jgi:hypothetical protein